MSISKTNLAIKEFEKKGIKQTQNIMVNSLRLETKVSKAGNEYYLLKVGNHQIFINKQEVGDLMSADGTTSIAIFPSRAYAVYNDNAVKYLGEDIIKNNTNFEDYFAQNLITLN